MSEEQLRLLVQILAGLCGAIGPIVPYEEWDIDIGRCQFCNVIGKVRIGASLRWEHKPECVTSLIEQLQRSVQSTAPLQGESVQDLLKRYEGLAIGSFLTQWAEQLGKPTQEITELMVERDLITLPGSSQVGWVDVQPLQTGWIHLTFRSKEHYKRHINFSTWEDVPDAQTREESEACS